jgi:predicted amidohydrolase
VPKTIQVSAAQFNSHPSITENVQRIRGIVAQAARSGSDAVLFPECALTGYNIDFRRLSRGDVESGMKAVATAARDARCHVLIGAPTFERRKCYNSLVLIDRRGRERFRYHKIHLTPRDREFFSPGNRLAFFRIDSVPCTAIICHERRYPELVRLPVMLGAQIVFHPNAGRDTRAVSHAKHGGRDGIAVRAFENQVFYVFANCVGAQGGGFWSAGDSKIVAPDSRVLALANNRSERVIHARLNLNLAGRQYAREVLTQPAFLRGHWKKILDACRERMPS